MNVGIIGSGVVAQTLGTKLVELGHGWVRLWGATGTGMMNIKVVR